MVHKQSLHPKLIQFRTRGINLLWTYLWHTFTNMCAVEIKDCKVTSFQKGRGFGSTSKFVNMLQNIIRVWWSPFLGYKYVDFFEFSAKRWWNPLKPMEFLFRQDHLCEHHGGGPEVLRPCVDGVAFLCRGVLHGSREGRLGEDWMIPGRLTAIHDGSYYMYTL